MRKSRGFTLIELMIVVAIIAIIAIIALPNYINQVRKSRRSDVEQAMQQIALFEERFRADCPLYANAFSYACSTLTTLVFPTNPYTSSYYTVQIVAANVSGTKYQIQAVAIGTQANDTASGTPCGTSANPLLYDYGVTTTGTITTTPAACWAK